MLEKARMSFNRLGAIKNYLVAAMLVAQVGFAWGEATAEVGGRVRAEDQNPVAYTNSWRFIELPRGKVAPPLKLLWDRSPILTLFERFNSGSYFSEASGRHLADTPYGLAVVMKRTLYLLDKQDGSTLWSLPLQGTGITDWKVEGDVLVYTAAASEHPWLIHAAVDLARGKHLWLTRETPKMGYYPQWAMIVSGNRVIYGTNKDMPTQDTELTARDLRSGELLWKAPNKFDGMRLRSGWFVYSDRLYAITSSKKSEHYYLMGHELATGKALPLVSLLFDEGSGLTLGAVRRDGTLFFGYESFPPCKKPIAELKISLVAYSMAEGQLPRETTLFTGGDTCDVGSARHMHHIAVSSLMDDPVVSVVTPNFYVVVNPANGVIIKKQAITGYVEWVWSPTLYSYPYLFTTARRVREEEDVHDLIALNLETGKVEWAYEIDRGHSSLENIVNFIVSGSMLYVSRADGRILAFRPGRMGGA